MAGPDVIRLKDVTVAMMKAQGGPKILITVPFTLSYVGAVIIESAAKLMRTKSTPFLNRNIMLQIGKEGFLDGTKARTELGWAPQISLEEGPRQYVQWRKPRT